MNDWRVEHNKVIRDFLTYLNTKSDDYVLKGGTSLMVCYCLDRFSEDIDLDSKNHSRIGSIVSSYCIENSYVFRIAKNTETVQRYYINYGNIEHPLKIEISFRSKFLDKERQTQVINGIRVYNLDEVFKLKLSAYIGRDKIRDLYDITFIACRYWEDLNFDCKSSLANALLVKGLEHFDYIIREQHDDLIDTEKLAGDFLDMLDKVGILYSKEETLNSEEKLRPVFDEMDRVLEEAKQELGAPNVDSIKPEK